MRLTGLAAATAYRRLVPRQPTAGGALPHGHSEAMLVLEHIAYRKTYALSGHDIAGVLWAAAMQVTAKSESRAPSELAGLVEALTAHVEHIPVEPLDIGTILWALASLDARPSDSLLASLTDATMRLERGLSAPIIANYLWSLGKLRRFHLRVETRLLDMLAERALACAAVDHSMAAQDVTSIVWAFARLFMIPAGALEAHGALPRQIELLAGSWGADRGGWGRECV